MSLPFLQPYFGLSNSLQTAQASAGGGGVGGWVELGRTTLGSAGDTISVASLANKRYLMFLCHQTPTGGTTQPRFRAGNSTVDSGSNYAERMQRNGAADATGVSDNSVYLYDDDATGGFDVGYIANYSTKEKLAYAHHVGQSTAGAGTAPLRQETAFKHAFTSNQYNILSMNNIYGSGDFATGSEVVVLGWDPADTHTNNFWTELYSGDLSAGAAAYIDSGTITAKKYLWVQLYTQQSVDSNFDITFNADTGSNYTKRWSNEGGADQTNSSVTKIGLVSRTANLPQFTNMFIINNSANEKLVIAHQVNQMTAGAGTAPTRTELVGKWANTAAQITSMRITSGSGNLATKTILKVWGSN